MLSDFFHSFLLFNSSISTQGVCKRLDIDLVAVLCTHKHWDHAGGNKTIKHLFPKIRIFGSIEDKPLATTDYVRDGDSLTFNNLQFQAISTPGHTLGHCVYLLNGQPFNCPDHIFTGDLLFQGGMGKIFEGNHHLMLQSLDKLLMFNNNSLIWPGHEYSKHCLEFAHYIDPENVDAEVSVQHPPLWCFSLWYLTVKNCLTRN